jgi:hypothetical protein
MEFSVDGPLQTNALFNGQRTLPVVHEGFPNPDAVVYTQLYVSLEKHKINKKECRQGLQSAGRVDVQPPLSTVQERINLFTGMTLWQERFSIMYCSASMG